MLNLRSYIPFMPILLALAAIGCAEKAVDYRPSTINLTSELEQAAAFWDKDYLQQCPHLATLKVGAWYGRADSFEGYANWVSVNKTLPECLVRVSPDFLVDLKKHGYVYTQTDLKHVVEILNEEQQHLSVWLTNVQGITRYDQELIQRLQVDFYRDRVTLTQSRYQANDIQQHLYVIDHSIELIDERQREWAVFFGNLSDDDLTEVDIAQKLTRYKSTLNNLKETRGLLSKTYKQAFFN